jgi:hypothetical protein
MAKLAPKPFAAAPKINWSDLDTSIQAERAFWKQIDDAEAALPEGEIVGVHCKWNVADGYAHYVVTKASPLTLAHVDVGDGYTVQPPMIRGLRKDDVLAIKRQNAGWRKLCGPREA